MQTIVRKAVEHRARAAPVVAKVMLRPTLDRFHARRAELLRRAIVQAINMLGDREHHAHTAAVLWNALKLTGGIPRGPKC